MNQLSTSMTMPDTPKLSISSWSSSRKWLKMKLSIPSSNEAPSMLREPLIGYNILHDIVHEDIKIKLFIIIL